MNFDYGNVLTRALQITWRQKSFWLFMMFPMLVASFIFVTFAAPIFLFSEDEDMMGLFLVLWLGVLALSFIVSLLVTTAGSTSLMLGILRVERGEGSTAFMDLVQDGFQYFGRVLGAVLIIQFSIGAVFAVFFLCVAALTAVTMGIASICLQPIMMLLTPLSFLVIAVMDGAMVAVIEEDLGSWDAIKRSLNVVREHVWKFILVTLIAYFGSTLVSSIFIFPATLPAAAAPILMESGEDISGQAVIAMMILFACICFPFMSLVTGITGTFMNSVIGISYLRLSRPAVSDIVLFGEEENPATS